MRDDLLDAQASVDWAVAQIPLLQQSLIDWQRGYPYAISRERDPKSDGDIVVAIQQTPLPLTFNAWFGAIFNSLRSSLDLLAAALAARNGEKTNRHRHFPIFDSLHDMIDPVIGIDGPERKKWLSQSERAAIKSLNPYKGGDATIWPLHQLDILRKHERLLSANPDVINSMMLGTARMKIGGAAPLERIDNKTILHRLGRGEFFAASKGNTLLALEVTFNEAAFDIAGEHVIGVTRRFAGRTNEIIKMFDVP
jgi:hypothetical protein